MFQFYTSEKVEIKAVSGSDVLLVKGTTTDIKRYVLDGDSFKVDLAEYSAGEYLLQFIQSESNKVLKQDTMKLKQSLVDAPEGFDHRSQAEITLQAINAYLSGVASSQQKRVKVGDKEIEYSSFDQLIKWKSYYEKQVRKQQGRPFKIRCEKLRYKGL